LGKYVYLGGRINNLTWQQMNSWREKAMFRLREANIPCYNPCDYLPGELRKGIVTIRRVRDAGIRNDEIYTQHMFHLTNHVNIYLINLDNPGRGTMIEWGHAHILGITIIGFGGKPEDREHLFIRKQAHCLFANLEEAIDYIIDM